MRLEDASVEIEEHDSQIAVPAIVSQEKDEPQEDLELYYQFPMTWLTYVANTNIANKERNKLCDARDFRHKRRNDIPVSVNKKSKCMEKLL